MQIVEIANEIMNTIADLDYMKKQFASAAIEKAEAISAYDKGVAISIAKLRHGEALDIDGQEAVNPPANVIGKVAAGHRHKEKERAELAQDRYRNMMKIVDILLAKLNGYQSIYKRLDNA